MNNQKKPKFDKVEWKKSQKILDMAKQFESKSSSNDKKMLEDISKVIPEKIITENDGKLNENTKDNKNNKTISTLAQDLKDAIPKVLTEMAKRRQKAYDEKKNKYDKKKKHWFFGHFAKLPEKSRLLEALTNKEVWNPETKTLNKEKFATIELDLKRSVMSKKLWASLTREYNYANEVIKAFINKSEEISKKFLNENDKNLGEKRYYIDQIDELNMLEEYNLPKCYRDIYNNIAICGTKGVYWPETMLLDKNDKHYKPCFELMKTINENFDKMQKELFIDYNKNSNRGINYLIDRMYNLSVFVHACKVTKYGNKEQLEYMKKKYPNLYSAETNDDSKFLQTAREKSRQLVLLFAEEVYKRFFFYKKPDVDVDATWNAKQFDCLRQTLTTKGTEAKDCVVCAGIYKSLPYYPWSFHSEIISRTVGNCYQIAIEEFGKRSK